MVSFYAKMKVLSCITTDVEAKDAVLTAFLTQKLHFCAKDLNQLQFPLSNYKQCSYHSFLALNRLSISVWYAILIGFKSGTGNVFSTRMKHAWYGFFLSKLDAWIRFFPEVASTEHQLHVFVSGFKDIPLLGTCTKQHSTLSYQFYHISDMNHLMFVSIGQK